MAKVWTPARDQNLLLLLIQEIKIDFSTLPQKWQEKYPTETFQPTSKALSEHVAKLKRNVKASTNATGSAKTWTAARDQNLLLLLIQEVKVDFSKLPAAWAKKYPTETFQPTMKAFSEHVAKLKRAAKSSGDATANASSTTTKLPTTGSVVAPATPHGKVSTAKPRPKRARAEMKNEESSEDEATDDQPSPAKKRATPRRSVTHKSYKEEEFSEDEDANASGEETSGADQDDFLTSGRATSRTVDFGADKADSVISRTIDFGADKADSAISNMPSPSKIADEHTPASLADDQFGQDMFRPIDSIARSKQSASRPFGQFEFFGNPVPEDDADDYNPLK
ncbi:unnamed protein product [Zymoseptoria tritici ST99CH_3D1]|nr:unnamed protein product [Zymoseptoria tritici ST99CH_3D1]